uniref:Uncharacterized protein n=1 Tax=Peronospora matthiolae TaxID=2874970 RepID=A0AAV1T3P4_9STRA
MRCAVKAVGYAAITTRFAATDKANAVNAAGDNSPSAPSDAISLGDAPLALNDYYLELIYAGESDGKNESMKDFKKTDLKAAMTEPSKPALQSDVSLSKRRDVSDRPRSQSINYDVDALLRHSQDHRADIGVGSLLAPGRKPETATYCVLLLRRRHNRLFIKCLNAIPTKWAIVIK